METMRLQKYIALCGVASRRAAEQMIREGRVEVNGEAVREMGVSVTPEQDRVRVDGQEIQPPQQFTYILLYKPAGVVTTLADPQGRPTVAQYLATVGARVVPVGRLDWDSEGLLLLTDDGDLVYRATHPSHEWSKAYRVRVFGRPAPEQLDKLRRGVPLDGRMTAPARVSVVKLNNLISELVIEIHEGRNRQIRRMCEAIGHPVKYLCRTRMGSLTLEGLEPGQWRYLTPAEIAGLK
jgi:23S rRNA pseudouridine2605 synthase